MLTRSEFTYLASSMYVGALLGGIRIASLDVNLVKWNFFRARVNCFGNENSISVVSKAQQERTRMSDFVKYRFCESSRFVRTDSETDRLLGRTFVSKQRCI
jgi:hypothetical protein